MPAPTSLVVQPQQFTHDCGVAALAMLTGQPYVTVTEHARCIAPKCWRTGMWLHEVEKTATLLGLRLARHPARTFPLDEATGILMLRHTKNRWGHLVVLFQGVLIDPSNGGVWDRDVYMQNHNYRPTTFLEAL